MKPVKAIINCV